MDRRKFVAGTVAGASALTFPVGGGGASNAAASSHAPVPAVPGKYRYQSEQLFQTARAEFEPSHLAGGSAFPNDTVGPTYRRVTSGWAWDNPGGDWIDATRTRQGKAAWFSVLANKASGDTAVYAYSVDCTTALQFVQTQGRWNAFFMRCLTAPRALAGVFNTKYAKPAINVVYAGGATGVLRCKLSGASDNSTSIPLTTREAIGLPVFLEFDKPTAAVQSAVMSFTITEHWQGSGSTPVIEFFVLDPPVNSAPTKFGVANTAALDAGLVGNPSIIGLHRYLDGSKLSAFTLANVPAISSGFAFDPYIYQGSPTHDYNSYPHKGLGKFINPRADWSLVDSHFSGEGFEPLAPGLGALRVPMAHDPAVVEGYDRNAYAGSSGASSYIFMPEPLFGYLDHIFVRYYTRIGTPNGRPYRMPIARRYQMRQEPKSALIWADCGGKTGITPSHMTAQGGNSGSSGGGWGWQLRHRWVDCTADETGPEVEGWNMGVHMWDYGSHNPAGYRYGGNDSFNDSFNQRGGLGGMMRADMWYCVETELKLNTVFEATPGFAPDGELRVWVDGRLAMEKTGMVFRSLPLMDNSGPNPPYNPKYIQPVRKLGVSALWFNWYHGGLTRNTLPRTLFVTGLAYGTAYIGPMKLGGA